MTEDEKVLVDEAIDKMEIAKQLLRDLTVLVEENSTPSHEEDGNQFFAVNLTMGQITEVIEKHDTMILLAMIGSGIICESSSPIHKQVITAICHLLAEREATWKKSLTLH